ncbi:MAG: hypothetical protein A3G52_04195 [Candidatus Taylorbacteria bacterium RIFCSPLOWO2_12_FULL_43_20]|uniref:Uncharacterized protein n=1 Tax=Candidatus Taylorbacteria bacterium RIFCSPLOWO2_12_FULL_43_20 TaxID=1802332 RepID=A0A1G2P059_9BACT|nr:MAG: hypothetical protein A2825_01330 [Candidatus Taylorbacteria bacterium RIFCSPHIGHO2_01_FULL_43_120]OHA22484.1 MAG: hypothetical protein A3B98_00840 [Candidatus Taylorbacteria bacterium RIFCSPHIGHO2_02_FULL_43_55]OHA28374.1 MAG: hypothetical protein A3E92_01630 [Candidatus Taylorbacteria bacterium RIFCSPHIGHO2_12_FULL_42_34]OHA30495.1 MAG: hypothetical protein A3B09_00595 [Candidatus Taylorbacteria bacterium RIFCSPLOWO2_01_FULL_43_83]OHA38079.1 MAG: hypothetical protein A3H58_01700 [Candi
MIITGSWGGFFYLFSPTVGNNLKNKKRKGSMQIKINGAPVEISVFTDRDTRFEVPVTRLNGEHGAIENVPDGTRELTIQVKLSPEVSMVAYIMQYGKNQILTRLEDLDSYKQGSRFLYYLPLWKSGGRLLPNPNGKSFRLFAISLAGRLKEVVVSVVQQGGTLFLIAQETYDEQLYRAGDVVDCPTMRKTKHYTLAMARDLLDGQDEFISGLPEMSQYVKPDTKKQQLELRYGEGLVLWYSKGKQLGAVLTTGGVCRCHWSAILTTRDRLKYLVRGEKILFLDTRVTEGTTQFKRELVDVQVEGAMPGLLDLKLELDEKDFEVC